MLRGFRVSPILLGSFPVVIFGPRDNLSQRKYTSENVGGMIMCEEISSSFTFD